MSERFFPRDLVIALKSAFEVSNWSAYLVGRIAEQLGTEETLRWWNEANEHEWFEFFQAGLDRRLGEKQAQREWERLISFWLGHRRDQLIGPIGTWREKTEKLKSRGIEATTFLDDDYPPELAEIDEPPTVLWSTQPLAKLTPHRLAVIGSRDMSTHGAKATRDLVTELAGTHGLGIVSGCARGIDWAAHAAAIKAGGQTIGVLGCGIERMPFYCHELAGNSQVVWISEFPPQSEGVKWHFPFRNRVIAALAKGVLVIEGGPRSGTMITANAAIELDRKVMVLSASGYNKNTEVLQKFSSNDAVQIVVTVENILDYLEIPHQRVKRGVSFLNLAKNKPERMFLQKLLAGGGRVLTASLVTPDCIDEETWENTRFELEARGVITQRLGTCELAGMVQS